MCIKCTTLFFFDDLFYFDFFEVPVILECIVFVSLYDQSWSEGESRLEFKSKKRMLVKIVIYDVILDIYM